MGLHFGVNHVAFYVRAGTVRSTPRSLWAAALAQSGSLSTAFLYIISLLTYEVLPDFVLPMKTLPVYLPLLVFPSVRRMSAVTCHYIRSPFNAPQSARLTSSPIARPISVFVRPSLYNTKRARSCPVYVVLIKLQANFIAAFWPGHYGPPPLRYNSP